MKCLVFTVLFFMQLRLSSAQEVIKVTTDKTTCLMLSSAIMHVDRGSTDVLVSNVKDADNLLLVKASIRNFAETNISIVTSDGNLYSILVQYDSVPASLVYRPSSHEKFLEKKALSDDAIKSYATQLSSFEKTSPLKSRNNGKVRASVNELFIKENVFFIQLLLSNRSTIRYDLDGLRFYIKDAKTAKRTAFQEREVIPIFMTANTAIISKDQNISIVVAMEKFTLPPRQYFEIDIDEKGGGRNIRMKVSNKTIMNAKSFPCF